MFLSSARKQGAGARKVRVYFKNAHLAKFLFFFIIFLFSDQSDQNK